MLKMFKNISFGRLDIVSEIVSEREVRIVVLIGSQYSNNYFENHLIFGIIDYRSGRQTNLWVYGLNIWFGPIVEVMRERMH